MTMVAVYGSLKEGFSNHDVLEGAPFLCRGVVDGYRMHSLYSYPMVVRGDSKVHVEVYEVDEDGLEALDRLEGYPYYYDRCEVEVNTKHCPVFAQMYFGLDDQVDGRPVVESGYWSRGAYESDEIWPDEN